MLESFLIKPAPIDRMLKVLEFQYPEKIAVLPDNSNTPILSIPANTPSSGQPFKAKITNLGHFICTHITGEYSTLVLDSASRIIDDGVNRLQVQWSDDRGRSYSRTPIPVSLLFSPGRMRSSLAANNLAALAAPTVAVSPISNSLLERQELNALFTANSDVTFTFFNSSTTINTVSVVLHGFRVKLNSEALAKALEATK
jgi:hypothetical protein